MGGEEQRFEIQWQGLVIEVLYSPDWIKCFREIYGYGMTKIEVRAIQPERAPLPITETGFIVRYLRSDDIEAQGGPVALVQAWLDHEAQSPQWKKQAAEQRQLSLF
jgi:hypothetical protein